MKRVPRTICKKDPSPSDDNFEGPSPMTVSTGTNDFPKEIEDVDDGLLETGSCEQIIHVRCCIVDTPI